MVPGGESQKFYAYSYTAKYCCCAASFSKSYKWFLTDEECKELRLTELRLRVTEERYTLYACLSCFNLLVLSDRIQKLPYSFGGNI